MCFNDRIIKEIKHFLKKIMKRKRKKMMMILMKINVLITQTGHLNVHPTMSLGVIGMIFGYPVSMLNVP